MNARGTDVSSLMPDHAPETTTTTTAPERVTMLDFVPESTDAEDIWEAMTRWCEHAGIEPYPEQEEAFLAIAEDRHVVLNTPTGSGKSLVALAAHFAGMCRGQKSIYTAPIKALVNEKFFDLCRAFGPDRVGLMTGDATVNREAPIICCTAEILAKMALAEGRATPFHWVVMDEFHFYSDRDRGMAWLLPLLEMTDARFLLMSATLREPWTICDDLERRTGRAGVLVRSETRPVPLEFEYRDCLLLESLEDIRRRGLAPAYIVSFTKRDAASLASQLRSTPVADEFKAAVRDARNRMMPLLKSYRFDTPFGKTLEKTLPAGVAVHHGGMLPKYRRLVERLARTNLVTFICGTDTLGVGVNMPIRTVVFTQLYKFDGRASRNLGPREFHQIAGRAGRKGHDDVGYVWVQAPEHEIRNARKKAKAAASSKKFHAESAPRGFKGWSEATMQKLRERKPAALVTRFEVTGLLVLQILERPGDGMAALRDLIRSVGEHVEENLARADEILASFVENGTVIDRRGEEDEQGRPFVVARRDREIRFDRPLDPFLEDVLARVDPDAPDILLRVLALVESTLDAPRVILEAQRRKARDELYHELRAEIDGPVTIEMQERLDAVEHPQPLREEIESAWSSWRDRHPFLADVEPTPKSIVGDIFARGDEFSDYVKAFDLLHDEGTLLRYLSDAYRVLRRNLPAALVGPIPGVNADEDAEPGEVACLVAWLDDFIRRIDESVIREWEQFETGEAGAVVAPPEDDDDADTGPSAPADITKAKAAFRVKVRTAAFRVVEALARHDYGAVPSDALTPEQIAEKMADYFERHEEIVTRGNARGPALFDYDEEASVVRQTILDPDDERTWVATMEVDLDASRAEGRAVLRLVEVGPART